MPDSERHRRKNRNATAQKARPGFGAAGSRPLSLESLYNRAKGLRKPSGLGATSLLFALCSLLCSSAAAVEHHRGRAPEEAVGCPFRFGIEPIETTEADSASEPAFEEGQVPQPVGPQPPPERARAAFQPSVPIYPTAQPTMSQTASCCQSIVNGLPSARSLRPSRSSVRPRRRGLASETQPPDSEALLSSIHGLST